MIASTSALYADVAPTTPPATAPSAIANLQENPEPNSVKSQPAVPQFNVSGLLGGGYRSDTRGSTGAFMLGLRPEIIFGRSNDNSYGIGVYGESIWMSGFGSLEGGYGGGVSFELAAHHFAAVPSLGVSFSGLGGRPLEPAAVAGGFVGFRRFNATSYFDASCGLRVDGRLGLGDMKERALLFSLQLDLTVLGALPFLGFH